MTRETRAILTEDLNQDVMAMIKQRRLQMLVHSYLYYEVDHPVIEDYKWSRWAKELHNLQIGFPKESEAVEYADEFKDWTGSSGAHLTYDDRIKRIASDLLRFEEEEKANGYR